MTKSKIITVVAYVVVVLAVIGAYFYPKFEGAVQGVSVVGTSNSSAKIASQTMAPATAAATTTSILNMDATDRSISSSFAYCTGTGNSQTYLSGAGLAALTVQLSTSSAAQDAKANTNYAGSFAVSTSSAWALGSTTWAINDMSRDWPTGTYLNITFNATNTAACTAGVHYLSL